MPVKPQRVITPAYVHDRKHNETIMPIYFEVYAISAQADLSMNDLSKFYVSYIATDQTKIVWTSSYDNGTKRLATSDDSDETVHMRSLV